MSILLNESNRRANVWTKCNHIKNNEKIYIFLSINDKTCANIHLHGSIHRNINRTINKEIAPAKKSFSVHLFA